jgi:hypothetical protein
VPIRGRPSASCQSSSTRASLAQSDVGEGTAVGQLPERQNKGAAGQSDVGDGTAVGQGATYLRDAQGLGTTAVASK